MAENSARSVAATLIAMSVTSCTRQKPRASKTGWRLCVCGQETPPGQRPARANAPATVNV